MDLIVKETKTMTDINILDLIETYITANETLIHRYSEELHTVLDGEFDNTTAEQVQILREQRNNFMQRKSVLEMLYEEICNNIDKELEQTDKELELYE